MSSGSSCNAWKRIPPNAPSPPARSAEKFLKAAGQSTGHLHLRPQPAQRCRGEEVAAGLGAAAAAILVAGLVWSRLPLTNQPIVDTPDKGTILIPKVVPRWVPDGYEAVSDERASDSPAEVLKLKRLADGVVFVRSERPGVYIPDDYNAEFSDPTNPDVVSSVERKAGYADSIGSHGACICRPGMRKCG